MSVNPRILNTKKFVHGGHRKSQRSFEFFATTCNVKDEYFLYKIVMGNKHEGKLLKR